MVINAFLFVSCFIPTADPLKIIFKSREIPLRSEIQSALKSVFLLLRETADFDSIYSLLNLKTVNNFPAYVESCSSIQESEYRAIIEHFYSTKQKGKLGLILSPECVSAMDTTIFEDSTNSYSISDLPRSLLATNNRTFSFRITNLKAAFRQIVVHALKMRFKDVKWDNLVYSIFSSPNPLKLSVAFDTAAMARNPILKSDLFYYLNPSMLGSCVMGEDIVWIMQMVLPVSSATVPFDIRTSRFVPPNILAQWNEQVFRLISASAFHLELIDLKYRIRRSSSNREFLETIEETLTLTRRSLISFYLEVTQLLSIKPACLAFKRILDILKLIHEVFITETIVNNPEINVLYRNITRMFQERAASGIQGDWMINLFQLFWKNKFRVLRNDYILDSIKVFFSKDPTLHAIEKVYVAYLVDYKFAHSSNKLIQSSFEHLIPENRLVEVFEHLPTILNCTFTRIPVEIRFALQLRESRKNLVTFSSIYSQIVHYEEIPKESEFSSKGINSYKNRLLQVFESTFEALYRHHAKSGTIYSYGPIVFATTNLLKPVDIKDCLKQFFHLILAIPEFRIIINNNNNIPVVILTPLIPKDIGYILGQAFAIASIINVDIPFNLFEPQFKTIFTKDQPSAELLNSIKKVCKKPGHMNLLKMDRKSKRLNVFRDLKNYFKFFYSWSNLFPVAADSNTDILIEKAFQAFNERISAGFRVHFNSSKFTDKEVERILFKINV